MTGIEDEMDEFELTPEEKMAFQRLPKEAEPSQLLEERVVRSLREEGILGSGSGLGAAEGTDAVVGAEVGAEVALRIDHLLAFDAISGRAID